VRLWNTIFTWNRSNLYAGRVEARILTAAQAQKLGYKDGLVRCTADHKLYVDGFNSMERVRGYLEDLEGCTLVGQPPKRKKYSKPVWGR